MTAIDSMCYRGAFLHGRTWRQWVAAGRLDGSPPAAHTSRVGLLHSPAPYRDDGWLLERLAEARSSYRAKVGLVPGDVRRVLRTRLARVGAGISGTVGAVALAVIALFGHLTDTRVERVLSVALRGAWLAMLVGAVVGWILAGPFAQAKLDAALSDVEGGARDASLRRLVERIEHKTPASDLHFLASRLETPSVAFPLVATSLLGPLSIHYLVWFGWNLLAPTLPIEIAAIDRDFGDWIQLSLLVVGHCHVVLAWAAWQAGASTPRLPTEVLATDGMSQGLRAIGLVTLFSVLPGVVLCLVPTAIVLVTGLFVPLAFAAVRGLVRRERLVLAR